MTTTFDHAALAALLQAIPDPVVVVGADATLRWANDRAEQAFGWRLADLQGGPLVPFVHPDDLETALLSLESVAKKETGTLIEIRVRRGDGSYAPVEIRGAPCCSADLADAVILVARETTDRRRWELGAGDTDLLAAILDAAPTVTLLLDRGGAIQGASRALTRQLHRGLEQTLGLPLVDLVAPADRDAVAALVASCDGTQGTRSIEAGLLAVDGHVVPMSLTLVDLVSDAVVRGIVVGASDISDLVEARSTLHHRANHDDLTGLPNRTHLLRRLSEVLDRDDAQPHTLLFCDVDRLKPVNDRHGHRAGDALLVEVATRLRAAVRGEDLVARLSGDEFVVVVPTADPEAVDALQARIHEAMAPPARLPDGTLVETSVSIGAAVTQPGLSAEEVLAAADAAMYVAKRRRGR